MKLLKVRRVMSAALGELPLKEGGGTFRPSGFKRDTQNGEVAENTGFVESPVNAELKLKLQAIIDPQEFANMTTSTNDKITIYLDGGGVHSMPGAWVTETPELNAGEYDVTYHSGVSQKLQ